MASDGGNKVCGMCDNNDFVLVGSVHGVDKIRELGYQKSRMITLHTI